MSWWTASLDVLAVVSGGASIYGAFVAWQQNRNARTVRAAIDAAVGGARQLLQSLDAQRTFGEAIFRGRRADQYIVANDLGLARDQLVEMLMAVTRLSATPTVKGRISPAT